MKKKLKETPIGSKMNLENKLNMRERAQKRKKLEIESDENFTRETGIENEANDYQSLDNMIKKMEFHERRESLKHAKMKKMGDEGVDFYADNDISVSEDEFEDEDQQRFAEFFKERKRQKESKEKAENLHNDETYQAH